MTRKTIYIYDIKNSARLQMAEGFAREYLDIDEWTVRTGGRERKLLHPLATKAMDEVGVDIRNQTANLVDLSLINHADYIINLSGSIEQNFRNLKTNARLEAWSFEEPERAEGSEENQLVVFRRVRDAINNRMKEFAQVEG